MSLHLSGKSKNCNENRIFCHICLMSNKHLQHQNEDVLRIQKLNQFLISKSKQSTGLISECQLQFKSTVKSYDKFIIGLSYKLCGLEEKINQFKPYQTKQALDSLMRFDEFKNHLKNNISRSLSKLQKILDDLYTLLELHLIQYQITDQQIKLNEVELEKGISLNSRNIQTEALNLFDKLLLIEPYNVEIMYQKANSLKLLNKLEDAQQIYKDIIAINPKHEFSLFQIGDILRNQKSYQQAQQYYEKSISINQNNQAVQFGLGECLRHIYQYNQALQYYLKAIELDSSNKDYFFYKGECLRFLERYLEAINTYDQVLIKDANHAEAMAGKGICLLYLGSSDEAQRSIKKSLSLKNNCLLGLYGYGIYLLNLCKIFIGINAIDQQKDAFQYFDKALAINPQDVYSFYGKAFILLEQNELENAYFLFNQANQIQPIQEYNVYFLTIYNKKLEQQ